MHTQPVLNNVILHYYHGQATHPRRKTTEQWIDALTDRLTLLSEAMTPKGDPAGKPHPSRRAAQLAGLCIRLIEEMHWPLIPPGRDTCADVEV